MKKIVCIATMLVLCFALACPVMAAETEFVPSIDAKNHPEVIGDVLVVNEDGETVATLDTDCIVLVAVSEIDSSTLLTDAEKALFKDVFSKLSDGSMTIPYPDGNSNKVVRDLFIVKVVCDDGHAEEVAKEDVFVNLTLKNGVGKDEKIVAMVYSVAAQTRSGSSGNGWTAAESVKNNGNGTVTVSLEHTGIVALAVPGEGDTPVTGDNGSSNVVVWSIVMVASVAALVAVVVSRRKIKEQ